MGHILGADGLQADPEKITAIREMPRPTDVQGVQRLIGVVTYLSKFLPQLSTVCEPLRRLTDSQAVFDWLPQHEEAFMKIKELITQAPVLRYFDVNKEVTIECDSSDVGLGAVLTQDGCPVAYASRALTLTERNYAQIEKECLAIVFAAERFEHYILGKDVVEVLSDHKPLMSIFTKPILTSPKRLQRMRLRLQKYPLKVVYKPGPQMFISDTLSRAALPLRRTQTDTPDYVIFQVQEEERFRQEVEETNLEEATFVTDQRLVQIRQETNKDASLQTLMTLISAGWPNDKLQSPLCVREYWPYRDELSTQNGLVFRGTRIIIPHSMRTEMTARAHRSHLGIQYTINTARDIMYWPRMTADLTEAVQRCETCQQIKPALPKEPMMTYPVPTLPWQIVACDCFECDNQHYLVVVDLYSDFIEIRKLDTLTTSTLVEQLKQVFAIHGVPVTLISDNGPNYASAEFHQFTQAWDFQHLTSSPHYPKSNGKAESAVKIMKSIITKANKDGADVWKAILEWRNSPTPSQGSSPVQRLMSRRTRSFLPCKASMYQPEVQCAVPAQVVRKRQVAKSYHDTSAKPLPPLVIGQPIRVKAHPQPAHSNWKPGVIVDSVAPRSYIVEVDGRKYRRNRVHLRDTVQSSPAQSNVQQTSTAETADSSTNQNASQDASSSTQPLSEQSPRMPSSVDPVTPPTSSPVTRTRSGRVVKPNTLLRDFVQ